jgi:hypothetical protein
MAVTKAAKAKTASPLNELSPRVEQLTGRAREERQKQMGRLEDQIDKARESLSKQLDSLHIEKLRDLQENYREKAEDVLRTQVDTVKKAVGDAGGQLRESKAVHSLLKAELNALQYATKQAHEVARVLSGYEKQVQKQLTQVERKIGKAAGKARKVVVKVKAKPVKAKAKKAAKRPAARKAKTTA